MFSIFFSIFFLSFSLFYSFFCNYSFISFFSFFFSIFSVCIGIHFQQVGQKLLRMAIFKVLIKYLLEESYKVKVRRALKVGDYNTFAKFLILSQKKHLCIKIKGYLRKIHNFFCLLSSRFSIILSLYLFVASLG